MAGPRRMTMTGTEAEVTCTQRMPATEKILKIGPSIGIKCFNAKFTSTESGSRSRIQPSAIGKIGKKKASQKANSIMDRPGNWVLMSSQARKKATKAAAGARRASKKLKAMAL